MKQTKFVSRLMSLTLISVFLLGLVGGCGGQTAAGPTPGQSVTGVPVTPDSSPSPSPTEEEPDAIGIDFKPGYGGTDAAYTPVQVTASIPDYTVNPGLSNVVNLGQFPNLSEEQREKLASNRFVVAPGDSEQLFYIYEDNAYKEIPNFVTTDSVLQTYHIFYDYTLRITECETLLPNALKLTANMLGLMQKEYAVISDPQVKAEAKTALGYFAVAQLAFGEALPTDFPQDVKGLAEQELERINAAAGVEESPLLGYIIDYSLFTPRGHYTRSEDLTRYFKGMSWYGIAPFPLYESDGKTPDTRSAMRAIIITTALCRLPESDGGALWESIYSPTAFFVGTADDLTPYQLAGIIDSVYGGRPDLNKIADLEKLDQFYQEAEELPRPQINAKKDPALAEGDAVPSGVQFRFMGQRYIPDSEILQELCNFALRPFPTGLDVFAALGSQRAADLIAAGENPAESWPGYTGAFQRMKAKFTSLPDSAWRSNMYYAWLWTQNSLTGQYGVGYPAFMRSTAWQDKSLTTALGSWAELRHDTILYAKQSAAECGGPGGDDEEPPVVRSYVEPNAELYNRLLWLTSYSQENLTARGVFPSDLKYAYSEFERMLAFLRDCSVKELRGEDLSADEYETLRTYGGELELLMTSCTEGDGGWYEIESQTDSNMAVIADVHTVSGQHLEEGVGSAAEIYVVVPMGGQLYLTRGAVFDYYEFTCGQRLTDEAWQAMLKADAPGRPAFTSSFLADEAREIPAPEKTYS